MSWRYEVKRRLLNQIIPTPSTVNEDDGYGYVEGSIADVIRQLDKKNYGSTPIFEEWNGLTAAAAADLTTATGVTLGGANWLGAADTSGTIAAASGLVTMTTHTDSGDGCALGATNWFRAGESLSTWNTASSKLVFEAVVKIAGTDVSTADFFCGLVGVAAPSVIDGALEVVTDNTYARIGFGVVTTAKTIFAINGDTTDTVANTTITAAANNVFRHFKFVYDFGAATPVINYYINGTLVATEDTYLPDATALAPLFYNETNTTAALATTIGGVKVYYL